MKKSAFTLLELLVVIVIIGILATVSIIALNNARAKSRDAKRVGDIKQISTALELFFNDKGRYPNIDEWDVGQLFSTSTNLTSSYMQTIPLPPTPADGNCADNENSFFYFPTCGNDAYQISFCLGNTVGALTPGPKCLTPGGISDRACLICGEDMIDFRDCSVYPTVLIGEQCWLAKNLAYLPSVDPGTQWGSGVDPRYYVYDYTGTSTVIAKTQSNYATYGALYNYPAASTACPFGWHLPSGIEWNALIDYLGGAAVAGEKMKATIWGNNSSGFNALSAGHWYIQGGFFNAGGLVNGSNTLFWQLFDSYTAAAYSWMLIFGDSEISSSIMHGNYGFSVRCLRD